MERILRHGISERIKDKIFLMTILSPALLLLCFSIFIPIIKSVYMSFFDLSLTNMTNPVFNGLKNYQEVLTEGAFLHAFKITVTYVMLIVSIQFVLGMLLSLLLNKEFRGRRVLRSIVLIPWIVPTIVVALLWMWIFQADYGLMNYVLMKIGILAEPTKWVADPNLALVAVIVAALWRQLPFMATMLLAGMQSIPQELVEAGTIDGANKWQLFRHITLPFLLNVIKTVTLVAIIENFKMFPLFWIMTAGGPMNKTTTLAVLSYQTSFIELDIGKGAAIGTLWLIILMIISAIYNKLLAEK